MKTPVRLALGAGFLILAAGAAAQPKERITLAQALEMTLESSPQVALARQDAEARRGIWRQASGRFDSLVVLAPSFERRVEKLTERGLAPQIAQRTFLRESITNLSSIATDISSSLRDPNGRPSPDCKGHQYYINGSSICSDSVEQTNSREFELLLNDEARPEPPANDALSRLQATINEQNRRRQAQVVALIRRVFLPALSRQLVALGAIAESNESDTLGLDLRYELPLRNGAVVGPVLQLQGIRSNFIGKSENPAFGGKGVPTLYRGIAGLSLDMPLAKSGGVLSVTAQERSARLNYDAALATYVQTASEALFATATAYWNLAGTQEVLSLFERSTASQRRVGEISDALIEADEIPRVERSRIQARTLDAEAAAAQARENVASARVELARAIGLKVLDIGDAPLAADPLPTAEDASRLDMKLVGSLGDLAVENRADVKAEARKRDAADVLVRAARWDLKPQIDLSLQVGWAGVYEDPRFRATTTFYPEQYWKAYFNHFTGPSIFLSVHFQLPIGNDIARGRLVQAQATLDSADISTRNTERVVRSRAYELAGSVKGAAAEVAARQTSSRHQEEVIQTSQERYRAGELSLVDTIVTERSLTNALVDLVGARQILAQRIARLRFETGTLLPYTISSGDVSFGTPAATGFSFTGRP